MSRKILIYCTDDPCYSVNCGVGTCTGGTCSCPSGYSGGSCQTCKYQSVFTLEKSVSDSPNLKYYLLFFEN